MIGYHWTKWYRTGESRIVPWYFGLMRAEFFWRRDLVENESGEVSSYQLKPRGAGRLPPDMDGGSASGFWSTLACAGKARYGWIAIWAKFCTFIPAPDDWKKFWGPK